MSRNILAKNDLSCLELTALRNVGETLNTYATGAMSGVISEP